MAGACNLVSQLIRVSSDFLETVHTSALYYKKLILDLKGQQSSDFALVPETTATAYLLCELNPVWICTCDFWEPVHLQHTRTGLQASLQLERAEF